MKLFMLLGLIIFTINANAMICVAEKKELPKENYLFIFSFHTWPDEFNTKFDLYVKNLSSSFNRNQNYLNLEYKSGMERGGLNWRAFNDKNINYYWTSWGQEEFFINKEEYSLINCLEGNLANLVSKIIKKAGVPSKMTMDYFTYSTKSNLLKIKVIGKLDALAFIDYNLINGSIEKIRYAENPY